MPIIFNPDLNIKVNNYVQIFMMDMRYIVVCKLYKNRYLNNYSDVRYNLDCS